MTSTSSASWPDSIVPESTRSFLQKFFTLLDADSQEQADAYGELFTEDAAYLVSGVAEIEGRKGKSCVTSLDWNVQTED